jgi:hypothetical protein
MRAEEHGSNQDDDALGRSYVCSAGWELRITERCLTEDFEMHVDTSFADAAAHDIVAAFETSDA